MLLHGLTIFLSAFLLFLAQPILAKLILPRFGGGVAVWATCLVFFQAALLLGYAYAHQLVRRDAAVARYAHVALLLASLALLPIIPASQAPALAQAAPATQILVLLVATIGLPFTLLATTSPLLQAWIARGPAGRNPYRLFAVSNLASLAALLLYPWLVEPWLRTATQAMLWSAGYAVYVVLLCVLSFARRASARAPAPQVDADVPPARGRSLAWIALAALAGYELVAVTNHLTQNIPSIPMMWVLPLALYLLSFALCFDADRWYAPRPFFVATLLGLLAMCWFLLDERFVNDIGWQAGVFLTGLFVVCMYCHGELAASRPGPSRLTHFYLCVAAGGVLGGTVVALGAPALLPGYFEVEIGLVLLAAAVLWRSARRRHRYRVAAAVLVLLCTAATALQRIEQGRSEVVAMNRNFYGVLRVREHGGIERTLMHGSIMHGEQYLADARRREPTSYYTETSGVGRLLTALDDRRLAVGLVGLGAGTLAAYGKPGDEYCFYEIDPGVVDSARRHFSFLADSQARIDVRIGDGRLLLEAEPQQRFDVLVVDAFSGDSIPIHLLTREALVLYGERIKPQGVIALHISNRHIDLRPVVGRLAAELGLQLAYVADPESDTDPEKVSSNWILLARDRSILDLPDIREATTELPHAAHRPLWTDDYSNILQVIAF